MRSASSLRTRASPIARPSSSIPDNIIQHVTVNGLNVGRNPQETLRVLDALQTDELCPCNWNEGQDVLRPAA
jgi:peroxiredoxin (alkyl hydroperoxide reductase subunit C)